MTQSLDSTTPPVNRITSRRRFLKMGAIIAAVGFAGPSALAGSRSLARAVKADSKGSGGKTTKTAEHQSRITPTRQAARAVDRSDKAPQIGKPVRAEARSTHVAQARRTIERPTKVAYTERTARRSERHARVAQANRRSAERDTRVARVEPRQPVEPQASRFAHIERASSKAESSPVAAYVERTQQVEIDEKPMRAPIVQAERESVVTPSTSFTRPAYPVQSDYGFSTPRAFARMERQLELYNSHTGESLRTVYWAVGKYLPSALREVNWLLRDHRSNETIAIDPDLLDLLYNLSTTIEARPSFQIISAYRSPATNAMLRMTSSGVAEHSQHIKGKAVDIRMPGNSLAVVRRAALSLQGGGVGYYPWSNFVHVDTGPIRSWLA
jgi:uncharacterized protein YcbK (DUF882 family)